MAEETKLIAAANKARGRYLYIANPGSDSSSEEEDRNGSQPPPKPSSSSYPQSYVYQPPALPHLPPPTALQSRIHLNTLPPPKHTTDFTQDHSHPITPFSQSTPNLSSPSSSSFRAIYTTPPPITPGAPAQSLYLGFDASSTQEPYTSGFNMGERDEGGQISARLPHFLDKIKARIPHRQSLPSRTSPNHNQDLSRRFSTPDSHSGNSTVLDQIRVLVTTDADQYLLVDVVGSSSGAAIREHIFTKLHVSDEDQKHYSIYRTEFGSYALGESLPDDMLYSLCSEQGDAEGSLRFLVSYTSAPVSEVPSPSGSFSPATGSTIPPPVLPFHNSGFPMQPQRRATPDSYIHLAGPVSAQFRVLITTDADQYLLLDIVGSSSGAAIREHIFAKLHVSDEDQKHYSIYRNQVGSDALGESLPDDALYNLCSEKGDANGSLRFFVLHTSALVHEAPPPFSSLSPTAGSTIPPPVLPFRNGDLHMRPQRRATGPRHSSVSLGSERLPHEASVSYGVSVSEDLEYPDRDAQRSTTGPHPAKVAALRNVMVSPDRGRWGSSSNRPPLYTLPLSSSNRELNSDANTTSIESRANLVPHSRHHRSITDSAGGDQTDTYNPRSFLALPAARAQLPQDATGSKLSQSIFDPKYVSAGPATLKVPYNKGVSRKVADPSHKEDKTPPSAVGQHFGVRMVAKSMSDLRNPQRSNLVPQLKTSERREPIPILMSNVRKDGSRARSATHVPTTGKSDESRLRVSALKNAMSPQSIRRPASQRSLSTTPNYANAIPTAIDPYSRQSSASGNYNRFGSEVDDEDEIDTPQTPRRQPSASSRVDYGGDGPSSVSHSFNQNPGVNPNASATRSPRSSRTSSFSAGLTASPYSADIQAPTPPSLPPSSGGLNASTYSADIHNLSHFDTDISPWVSPREWNDAYHSHICAVLQGWQGQLAGIRNAYLGSYMVYPGLIIYIFIQLVECEAEAQKDFGDALTKWRTWDDITAIEKHQQVKDYLMEMFVELKRLNSVLHTRETFETLLVLDVLNFSAQLTMLVMNDDCYKKLIKRHEEAAQALVNILQVRLDYPIEPPFISRHRQALVKLSERSQRISECLLLEDITISENPVQGGSFGDVFKGDMAGCIVAVKVLRVYQESNMDKILKSFSREAVIWRQLSHPNVLPFYGVFRRGVAKLCLVSPWMQNGDMSHFLSQTDEIDCVPLALDVAKGLEYLHSQRVLHGDLKCGNILVSDAGRACLADFGFSIAKDSNSVLVTASSTKGAGTLAWTAPELALGTIAKPDEACDVYSFGMVCYEMFSGCTPFAGNSIPQVITAIHLGQRPERPDDLQARKRGLTNRVWKIIATCWHKTSGKRFTAGQAVQRLSTLPDRPPDNRPVDNDPRLSRYAYRQPHHPFSILEMISKREGTGTPCVPGSISQTFGLVDLWDSDG